MKNIDNSMNWFVDRFTICVIADCLETGKITPNDSLERIKSTIYSEECFNPDKLGLMFIHTDSLKESIELLLSNAYYNEAIVLAMTCIEHTLNSFYAQYFDRVLKMSNTKKEGMLKANNVSEKVGGLYLAIFKESFPQNLNSDIMLLNKKRNEFVHYKSPIVLLDDFDEMCMKDNEIEKAAHASLPTIDALEDFILEKEMILYPNQVTAQNIFNRIKEEENNEKK